MAVLTVQDIDNKIAEVEQAMSDCISGAQSYQASGRSISRVPYEVLQKRLEFLLSQRKKMTGGLVVLSDQSGLVNSTTSTTQDSSFINSNA